MVLVGTANPFFDREVVARICGLDVSGGWLSFAVLAVKGTVSQDFMTIYAVIISFYFGTQHEKSGEAA